MGASLPGHDLAGNQIACRLVGHELAHDLDIETLQRLESLLADDLGTMLLVSRARLNDVATGTLVIEDDGLVKEQEASHDGDLRQRPTEPACQSGPDPDDPGSKAADVSREQPRKLILNHARSGFCSTQTSWPVSGSVTFCLSKCFWPRAMAMAAVANSRCSPSSSIMFSIASLIRLPRE